MAPSSKRLRFRTCVTALITAVITDTIAALTNGQLEWAVGTYGSTATLAIG
jgi:hypothetical protein